MKDAQEFEEKLRILLSEFGMELTYSPTFTVTAPTRTEGDLSSHYIRAVSPATLTIHANVEKRGTWIFANQRESR